MAMTIKKMRQVIEDAGLTVRFDERLQELHRGKSWSATSQVFGEFCKQGLVRLPDDQAAAPGEKPPIERFAVRPRRGAEARRSDSGGLRGRDSSPAPDIPRFVRVEEFKAATCSSTEAVRYTAGNLAVANPQPGECPGPEAWAMLWYFRQCPGDFWTGPYKAMLPKAPAAEQEPWFKDTGQSVLDTIAMFRRAAGIKENGDDAASD